MAGEVAKEAGKMVADAALNAIFQGVSQIASPLIYKKLDQLFNFEDEVKKLSRTLLRIEAVLNDARERHFIEHAVRLWVRELRAAALDAEDVVDEMETEYLRRMLESGIQPDDSSIQVLDLVSELATRFSRRFEIAPKLRSVLEKLDEIARDGDALGLRKGVGWGPVETIERLESTSLVDESCVFGRRDDRDKIINWLMSDGSGEGNVPVLPIVGIGGIGKTTLAQLVYNDERVKAHFGVRAWVSVPQVFDIRRLTKAIIHSATRRVYDLEELESLQVSLMEVLRGKIYLLVLDDVWFENSAYWECLRTPLVHGLEGSKIIITTQSGIVSKIMGTIAAYELDGLSDGDSLSLLKQVTKVNLDACRNLLAIGEKIVKKCENVPLAVKTLGGMLQGKVEENEWNVVLNSKIWDLPENKNGILAALRLSYHHLPAHLKHCFEYFSLFPKGYGFQRNELVQMWIAEGFLQATAVSQMEEIGNEYFDELLLRSFFKYHGADKSKYTMHDLIRSLAESISAGEYFRMEDDGPHNDVKKARHASSIFLDIKKKCKTESLRTFLLLQPYSLQVEQIPHDFFQDMRCLRVLDLSHTSISKLPHSVEKLKHLRYLNLSSTAIENLPRSTCSLYNLQTLRLKNCSRLTELPSNMKNLTQLRHLILDGTTNLLFLPSGIGRLTSLQTLLKFIVRKKSGRGIGELKDLMNLRGAIDIHNLENVTGAGGDLNNKQYLHRLKLEWSHRLCSTQDGVIESVLEGLQPHANLKELRIKGYSGVVFPMWMSKDSLSNLVSIHLSDCMQCVLLPSLGGLPLLKHLHVNGMHKVQRVDCEFSGIGNVIGFPSLESLTFHDMREWRAWHKANEGEIPRLHELIITKCPMLCELPIFPSLRVLKISGCGDFEFLPKGMHNITSLQHLETSDCNRLHTLPEERLPTSLETLRISNCPILQEWCQNEIRGGWHLTTQNPVIQIDQ